MRRPTELASIAVCCALAVAGCAKTARQVEPPVDVRIDSRTGEPGRYINRLDSTSAPVVWARAGERLLIPVTPTAAQIAEGSLTARLDRGDTLYAPLYQLVPSRGIAEPTASRNWLADFSSDLGVSSWSAKPSASALANPEHERDPWFVSVDMPRNAAGQGLWLASRRVPIGWLLDPPYQPPPMVHAAELLRANHAELTELLGPALSSPFARWRARLGLTLAGVPEAHTAAPFADVLVESLAVQIENEWNIGLLGLGAMDEGLARRIRERLAGIVVIAPSKAEPTPRVTVVWNPDPTALDPLKRALLATDLRPEERVQRARDWLAAEPGALAWVVDDAGSIDARSSRIVATMGLMHLPGAAGPAAVFVTPPERDAAPAVASVAPGEMTTLPVAGDRPNKSAHNEPHSGFSVDAEVRRRGPLTASIGIGEWRATRELGAFSVPALPPGHTMGPLQPDWTLTSWWAASRASDDVTPRKSTRVASGSPTVAILLRDQAADGAVPGASVWMVYIECRDEATGGTQPVNQLVATENTDADQVRLWIGPMNAPVGTITVRRDGTFETRGAAAAGTDVRVVPWTSRAAGALRTSVRNRNDEESNARANPPVSPAATLEPVLGGGGTGWSAWVRLPRGCIESVEGTRGAPASVLRLGFDRTDPQGRRSAWPRALLPWQTEPGRLWLDLSQWQPANERP